MYACGGTKPDSGRALEKGSRGDLGEKNRKAEPVRRFCLMSLSRRCAICLSVGLCASFCNNIIILLRIWDLFNRVMVRWAAHKCWNDSKILDMDIK